MRPVIKISGVPIPEHVKNDKESLDPLYLHAGDETLNTVTGSIQFIGQHSIEGSLVMRSSQRRIIAVDEYFTDMETGKKYRVTALKPYLKFEEVQV